MSISTTFTPTTPKPIFARPGRLDIIKRQLELADWCIKVFGEADSSFQGVRLDDRIAAKQKAMASLADARQRLVDERERTTETPCPAALKDHVKKEAAELDVLIDYELIGARGVVQQFLARSEPEQALRYARQLIGLPDHHWRKRYGDG